MKSSKHPPPPHRRPATRPPLYRAAAAILLLFIGAAAEASGWEKKGELKVDGAQIELAEVDGERLWIFRQLPSASSFEFFDDFPPDLRTGLLEQLETLRGSVATGDCEAWLVALDQECSLVDSLVDATASTRFFRIVAPSEFFRDPPVDFDFPSTMTWDLEVKAPEPIEALMVEASLEACSSGSAAPGDIETPADGDVDALRRLVSLPRSLAGLDIRFRLRCDDGAVPTDDKDLRALHEVVAAVLVHADAQNLVPGRELDEEAMSRLVSQLRTLLISGLEPPRVDIERPGEEHEHWLIEVGGLKRVEQVEVELECQTLPDGLSEQQHRQLKEKREEIRRLVAEQYVHDSAFLDRVPLRRLEQDEVLSLLDLEQVVAFVRWRLVGGTLTAVVRPPSRRLELGLSGGLGYSEEKGLYGTVRADLRHWIEDQRETRLELAGKAGEQTRELDLDFDRREIDPARRLKRGFSAEARYHLDEEQLLGASTIAEPGTDEPETDEPAMAEAERPVEEEVNQARAAFSIDYDSWDLERKIGCALDLSRASCLVRHAHEASLAFEVRDVDLSDEGGAAAELVAAMGGQVDRFVLETSSRLVYDRRSGPSGLGAVSLQLDGEVLRAEDYVGGDFEFDGYRVLLVGELFFGWQSRRDLLLRHGVDFGVRGASTPIFELFRLGGEGSVRGLEEGEATGRALYVERTELGILLSRLLELFSTAEREGNDGDGDSDGDGDGDGDGDRDKASDRVGGFVADTYFKIFYDRGGVAESSSFSDLRRRRDDFTGYGAALELRNLEIGDGRRRGRLSLGWARSSDSRSGSGKVFAEFAVGLGL